MQGGDEGCTLAALAADASRWPFRVESVAGMGRCWIATRDIAAGETIEHELPLIWWDEDPILTDDHPAGKLGRQYSDAIRLACSAPSNRPAGSDDGAGDKGVHDNVVNMLTAYALAPEGMRRRCDDFAVCGSAEEAKLITSLTSTWSRLAERLFARCKDAELLSRLRTPENVVELLTRSHINAHGMAGGHAMLELASKSNHSCSPNASYAPYAPPTSSPALKEEWSCSAAHRFGRSTHMRVFAIKRIRHGEQIFSTYIGGLDMLASTGRRRALLLKQKAFFCRCSRCAARNGRPDPMRRLRCPACRRVGALHRYDLVDDMPTYDALALSQGRRHPEVDARTVLAPWPWLCHACGRRYYDGEVLPPGESRIADTLKALRGSAGLFGPPPLQFATLALRDGLDQLAPTHHLTIEARILVDAAIEGRLMLLTQVHTASTSSDKRGGVPGTSSAGVDDDSLAELHALHVERCANLWRICTLVRDAMAVHSPVVVANLTHPRLVDLLELADSYQRATGRASPTRTGTEQASDALPPGIPAREFKSLAGKVAETMSAFFGSDDADVRRLRRAASLDFCGNDDGDAQLRRLREDVELALADSAADM